MSQSDNLRLGASTDITRGKSISLTTSVFALITYFLFVNTSLSMPFAIIVWLIAFLDMGYMIGVAWSLPYLYKNVHDIKRLPLFGMIVWSFLNFAVIVTCLMLWKAGPDVEVYSLIIMSSFVIFLFTIPLLIKSFLEKKHKNAYELDQIDIWKEKIEANYKEARLNIVSLDPEFKKIQTREQLKSLHEMKRFALSHTEPKSKNLDLLKGANDRLLRLIKAQKSAEQSNDKIKEILRVS